MERLRIGARFTNYREVLDLLNEYCVEKHVQFSKRNGKPLLDRSICGLSIETNVLMYQEVEFACSSRTENIRCPAFFKFRVPSKEACLELVALNNRHSHDLHKCEEGVPEPPPSQKSKESEDEGFTLETQEVKFTFRGLMAPTLTPFKDDLTLNLGVIQEYAEFLADSGVTGVLVNGTSGEGMSMNVEERKQVTEEWVKAVKDTNQHLMVQIGGAPLPDVLELAKHAEAVGVQSLLCLPDLYNKPTNSADLIRYLKTVSDAAPKTPLLYYHIPSYTHVNIHMGQFLNDSIGKIPTFHGIKFTSNALDEGTAAVKANDGKYAVFLGADQLMAGAYTLGFDSAIATSLNIFPQFGIKILQSIKSSKIEEAQEAQNNLTNICAAITKNGAWVPTMKVAMNLYTPINVGQAREPLQNITFAQANEMKADLKQCLCV